MDTPSNRRKILDRMESYSSEHDQKEAMFNELLIKDVVQIVQCLGGLQNILQLCLSHPDANEKFEDKNVNILNNLITEKTGHHNNNMEINSILPQTKLGHVLSESKNDSNYNTTKDSGTDCHDDDNNNDNDDADHDHTRVKQNTTIVSTNINYGTVLVSNLNDYQKTRIIMSYDATDNLYFKYLSKDKANKIFYNVTTNNKVMSLFLGINVIVLILTNLYGVIFRNSIILHVLILVSFFITSIHVILYIFAMNLSVCQIIFQTFDFWGATLVLLVLNNNDSNENTNGKLFLLQKQIWFVVVAWLLVYLLFFIIDALPLGAKKKQIATIACSSYTFYIAIWGYLFMEDKKWNPFESYNFQHSQISFKSLYLSSLSNLAIFILKPVFAEILQKIKQIHHKCSTPSTNDTKTRIKHDKCYSVHKRPFVEWKNLSITSSESKLSDYNCN